MKATTFIAAASLAFASTAAVADNAAVTTDAGEIVMIEKNQSGPELLATLIPVAAAAVIIGLASSAGSK